MTGASEKPLLRVLAGESLVPPPIWLMRQAGRYLPEYRAVREKAGGFLELCFTPELACEVSLQPVRRFDFDAAILFSDILVIAYALGRKLRFEDGAGPRLDPLSLQEIDELESALVLDRLAPIFETVHLIKRQLAANVTLIGFAGAPWTVATYMIEGGGSHEFPRARRWVEDRPDRLQALLDCLVTATVAYLNAQIEAGAEVVQLFDSWAGALQGSELLRWSLEPMAKIVAELKARHPTTPVILFPRGAGALYDRFADIPGTDAIGLDTTVPADRARALQQRLPVQGNLDPEALVAGEGVLEKAIERTLSSLGHGPLIFNLGHGVLPQTSPDHVDILVRRVRAWRP